MDHDLSHSHTERSTNPLEDTTQSEGDPEHTEEKRARKNLAAVALVSFSLRVECVALFILSIGGLFFFGFFDVKYVLGLCMPLLVISAYFVCHLRLIHMPPDADNDGQFESGEEEYFAPDTAMANDDSAFRSYVLTLCVSYIVVVLCIVMGPPQSFLLTNIFSSYCFAAYFILTKPEARDRVAYEVPRVGGSAGKRPFRQGRELVHSTPPPPTETSPLIVRGIQVV